VNITKANTLLGHNGPIYTIIPGLLPHTLISGGSDGLAVEWNLETIGPGAVIAKVQGVIYSIAVLGTQYMAIGTDKGGIHIIDLNLKREVKYLLNHANGVFDIAYLPKHNQFVALSGDGSFSVWDAQTFTCLATIKLCDAKLRSISINAAETQMAIACGDNTIRIFSTDTLTEIHQLANHTLSVNAVKYHPNGQWLLSGSRDAHLNVYDIEDDYALLHSIPAHNFAIYSITFNIDNTLFATASRDKTAKVWNANTLEVLQRIDKEKHSGHINSVNKALWLNNYLITCSDDRAIILWQVEE
jgi:WD repeat-containing protein 61